MVGKSKSKEYFAESEYGVKASPRVTAKRSRLPRGGGRDQTFYDITGSNTSVVAGFRQTGGRRGLWLPKPGKWGTMRLTTIGRRTGKPRHVILGYYEDGPNLVTLAMNGWAEADPAWWLNLKAHPDAVARLAHQHPRLVHARVATAEEHDRLWRRWAEIDDGLDAYAKRRSTETPVVVLEPRGGTA